MLLSFLLLSKLSSTVCSLSLKTPSFWLPDTLSLSFSCFLLCVLTSSIFLFLPPSSFTSFSSLVCFFFSYSLTALALHLMLFFVTFSLFPFLSAHLSLSLPLSSLSSPPLCRPHQRSRSLVSLSLGWHREQAHTWEGCFVIQQVIPPWQRDGGGAGADGMQGGSGGGGRTEQAYTTTYQPIPLLHPSVCELMVSPFFPTDNRRSRLATSSKCVEVLGASREGRKETRKEVWE